MSADVAIAPEPGVAKPDPVLTIDGMSRAFGGLLAVDIDHLEIQRNTITSIIGPNGAGKTTLFNLLTGFEFPDHGTYSLDGEVLIGVPAYRVAQRGMVRTFQLTKVLPRLTVLENMLVAAKDAARSDLPRRSPGWVAQRGASEPGPGPGYPRAFRAHRHGR